MKTIFSAVQAFVADEDGVTAIEYGLLAAMIGLSIIAGATELGTGINDMFVGLKGKLEAALAGTPATGTGE